MTVTLTQVSSKAQDVPAAGAVPDDAFTYDAFISYSGFRKPGEGSRFDRQVAERLHKSLEGYRTPRALLKRAGGPKLVPRRLGKVFRDRDEVHATSNLNDSLSEALRRSRFLIVICSPRARQSRWINQEIVIFRSLGRGERILTLLIEGEPAEAFPEELFKSKQTSEVAPAADTPERLLAQPLAADIRASSIAKSLRLLKQEKLRLLAPLLGCGYDDLRQREHERFVRRAMGAGTAMLTLLLVLATLSLLLFFAQRQANRNKQLALNAGSELLSILGLAPDSPTGINNPLTREVSVTNAIKYLEEIRGDDPRNLKCLLILRTLYGVRARLLEDRNRVDESRQFIRKAVSMVTPIALSRLADWEPTERGGDERDEKFRGESISFPQDYDRRRLRNMLTMLEQLARPANTGDALDYVDMAAEYVPLLDTSTKEGRAEARRVLQISLDKFRQAQTSEALAREQEELVEFIEKTLDRLPPVD